MTTKPIFPLLRKSRHFAQTHPILPTIQKHTHRIPQLHNLNRRHNRNSSTEIPPASSNDYFPWRHSPSLPTRIQNRDDFSGMPNNFRARFVRRMIAGRELNRNFWEILPLPFDRGWEKELAENFSTGENLDVCWLDIHVLFC